MTSERGMTLLELLVGLMVLGLTGLLLSGGVSFGARVWDQAAGETKSAAARFEAGQTLRRLIEQAEPEVLASGVDAFRGDGLSLAFLSYRSARLTGGRGRLVELYHSGSDGEVRLRISDPAGIDAVEDLTLIEYSAELSLNYFGPQEVDAAPTWTTTWASGIELPILVEVNVIFLDDLRPLKVTVAPRKRYPLECAVHGWRTCWNGQR